MRREFTIQSKVDGLILDGLVVEPEEGVKRTALLQLSHGMSEYKERYLPFMEYMAEHGVVCVIHDHRGHGKSVKSEQDLGFMYGAGGVGLVEDLFLVTKWAKKEYPDLPFVLMGHSMGSLVVRAYAKEHDQELDALIVCGSPSKNYLRPLGAAVGHAEAAVLGDEHRSNLLEAMSFGSFAARFADEKSRFAWKTKATRPMRSAGSMSRTSVPPTRTCPESASQKRGTRLAAVVFPPPEGPTSATVAPAGTSKETWSSAGSPLPSYVKVTSLKRMELSAGVRGLRGASITGAASTSSTRFTASVADWNASDMNITRVMAVGITAEKIA